MTNEIDVSSQEPFFAGTAETYTPIPMNDGSLNWAHDDSGAAKNYHITKLNPYFPNMILEPEVGAPIVPDEPADPVRDKLTVFIELYNEPSPIAVKVDHATKLWMTPSEIAQAAGKTWTAAEVHKAIQINANAKYSLWTFAAQAGEQVRIAKNMYNEAMGFALNQMTSISDVAMNLGVPENRLKEFLRILNVPNGNAYLAKMG
jgi:hypothetical protein